VKRVLITGGTGVVGSALTPLFLNEPETEVHLLVRARDAAHLTERRQTLFSFWGEDVTAADAGERLRLHRGDVSLPRLGLPDDAFDALAKGLTHVVHSAATVRMDMSQEQAWASCVSPVEQILKLLERAKDLGAAPKLDAVSTLGVAGRLKGLVPEAAKLPPRGFHNSYEWAKAEAEAILLSRIAGGDAITLHRPSMVVGHSQNGKVVHRQIFYHLCRFLSGTATQGFTPDLGGVSLDLVPCDYVARAIHWSATAPEARGQVLHLCAGPQGAVPIMALASHVREAYLRHGYGVPKQRLVPFGLFETAIAGAAFLPGRSGRRFSALRRFLDHVHCAQFFANEQSQALLAPAIGAAPGYQQILDAQLDAAFAEEQAGGSADAAGKAAARPAPAVPKGAVS